jgi:hypothetical protein
MRTSTGGQVRFEDQCTNCSSATLEAFSRSTGGFVNGVELSDPVFNGYYNDWQRTAGPNSPRDGAVGVLVNMGIAERVGSIDDIRRGDIVQGYQNVGGAVGHQFVITAVNRTERGEVLGYEMISANVGAGNTIQYQMRDRNFYSEMYIGRLYDSTADVSQ